MSFKQLKPKMIIFDRQQYVTSHKGGRFRKVPKSVKHYLNWKKIGSKPFFRISFLQELFFLIYRTEKGEVFADQKEASL